MNSEQFKQLHEALLEAFPSRSHLKLMLRAELGWKLDELTSEGSLASTVHELLTYAESRNRVAALVKAACKENPDSTSLSAASRLILEQPAAAVEAKTPCVAAAKVPAALLLYAGKDQRFADDLMSQLAPLVQNGLLQTPWRETDIPAGAVRSQVLQKQWQGADLIVLLISADFLASRQEYLAQAQKRMAEGATVIPVLVRPCGWEYTWLGEKRDGVQFVPCDAESEPRAVSTFSDVNDAWNMVRKEVAKVVRKPRP